MPIPSCSDIEVRSPTQRLGCCRLTVNSRPEPLFQEPPTRQHPEKREASNAKAIPANAGHGLNLKVFDDFLQRKLTDLRMCILCELYADQGLCCAEEPKESMASWAEPKKECMSLTVDPVSERKTDAGTQTDGHHHAADVLQAARAPPRTPEHGTRPRSTRISSMQSQCDQSQQCEAQHTTSSREEKLHSRISSSKSDQSHSRISSLKSHQSQQRSMEEAVKSELASFQHLMTWDRVWECVMTLIVTVHCLAMAIEIQIKGYEVGRALRSGGSIDRNEIVLIVFKCIEYVFACVYTVDVVAKVVVERWLWVKHAWNWLDLVTVLATFADMFTSNASWNPSVLKLLRLARFHRVLRVVNRTHSLESCILILRSVRKSTSALLWSAVFIFTFVLVSGLVVSQAMASFFENEHVSADKRLEVFWRFGTFSRAVLTMFEITLGNWGPPAWSLVDNVHEALMIFILFYKISAGFAMLNVINAVFLRETMKCSEEIDEFTILQKKKAQDSYIQRLGELFLELDSSGDGLVTFDEFQSLIEKPSIVAWLDLLEISKKDSADLFHSLDSGDGAITIDEWMRGVSRIKGDATAVDAMTLMAAISRVEANIIKIKGELIPEKFKSGASTANASAVGR